MKELIYFSLERRFKNKSTILLHLLMILLLFCFVYIDKIANKFFINNDQTIVYYDESVKDYIDYLQLDKEFIFEKGFDEQGINLKFDQEWEILSQFPLDILTSTKLKANIATSVLNKWYSEINDSSLAKIIDILNPQISEKSINKEIVSKDKVNVSMFLITGIYFGMLSFSTMIANEVVYEKTTKVLELILTSISTKVHFFSKMIIGFLTIIIQIVIFLFEASLIIMSRNYYDKGSALLQFLNKYQILFTESTSFKAFLISLNIDKNIVLILITSLLFMVIGMLTIQTIMVSISSFINAIEESNGIQAPAYLVLLVIYYLALALNSPMRLNSGLGYIFSFVPIFSMLFMPMRLLLVSVSIYEVLLAVLINFVCLVIIAYWGSRIYEIGILNTNKKKKKLKLFKFT